MSVSLALAQAGRKPAGKRPYFLHAEVERIDTLERLLEAKGVLDRPEIEAFVPAPEQAAERGLWTQEYIARVLRILQQEGEAIAAGEKGDLLSEEVAVELSAGAPR
jgi:hypothetical protein